MFRYSSTCLHNLSFDNILLIDAAICRTCGAEVIGTGMSTVIVLNINGHIDVHIAGGNDYWIAIKFSEMKGNM